MRKLTQSLMQLVLPKATAKAAPVRGKCLPGCGGSGAWYASKTPDGKIPCC